MVLFHEFFLFCTSFYNYIDALFSDAFFKKTYKKSGIRRFDVYRNILCYLLKAFFIILYTELSTQFHTPLSSISNAIPTRGYHLYAVCDSVGLANGYQLVVFIIVFLFKIEHRGVL